MIGIFGGTFDPVHFGHLRAALDCQQGLGLSEVRLLPLSFAVHRAQPVASPELRLNMLRAAIAGEPMLTVDDRELRRGGPSYTVETLASLRTELGSERPLCLMIGADSFNGFLDWRRPLDILGQAHLVIMQRPGAPMARDPALRTLVRERRTERVDALREAPAGRILFQTVTQLDISSTRIRRLVAGGHSPRFLLPEAVIEVLQDGACYRDAAHTTQAAKAYAQPT